MEKNNQEKSGTAARMQTGKGLRVGGRQGKTGFMAMDGFMFRTVVLEGSTDFRNTAAEDHITDQDEHLHKAADQRIADGGHAGTAEQAFHAGGQRNEKGNGKNDCQNDGKSHDDLIDALAKLAGEPLFELSGFFIQHAEHFGGVFKGVHSVIKHGTHIDDSADERLSHPGMLLFQRNEGCQLGNHSTVRTADSNGSGIGRTHHHAFHHSLTADIEFFFLFCIHNKWQESFHKNQRCNCSTQSLLFPVLHAIFTSAPSRLQERKPIYSLKTLKSISPEAAGSTISVFPIDTNSKRSEADVRTSAGTASYDGPKISSR